MKKNILALQKLSNKRTRGKNHGGNGGESHASLLLCEAEGDSGLSVLLCHHD